jgi:hypothetical protein
MVAQGLEWAFKRKGASLFRRAAPQGCPSFDELDFRCFAMPYLAS